MKDNIKILRAIIGEGYKLKAQHNNPEWRKALEDAEGLLIKLRSEEKQEEIPASEETVEVTELSWLQRVKLKIMIFLYRFIVIYQILLLN